MTSLATSFFILSLMAQSHGAIPIHYSTIFSAPIPSYTLEARINFGEWEPIALCNDYESCNVIGHYIITKDLQNYGDFMDSNTTICYKVESYSLYLVPNE